MFKLNAFNRFTTRLLLSAAPAALAVMPSSAFAQTAVPGGSTNAGTVSGGVISTGVGPTFSGATSNGAGADISTITLNSSRAILNWNGFNLSAGDTLNYIFGANTDIVLNRVDGASAATINGAVFGKIGSTAGASGGNIWFLAPGGIMVGSTGSINAGGLLFSTGSITDADFFNSNFNFLDASNNITVSSGASLTASNGALTLLAPSISFNGNAVSSGSIALVGASDARIVFDGDMDAYVALTINEGSSQNVAVDVGADASFNAAAPASGGKTYIVAAGNGVGLGSVVIGGTAANRVEFDEGDVVLYAAGNVPSGGSKSIVSGGVLQGLGSATGGGDVTIGAANVDIGSLDVRAVDDVTVNDAVSVSGNARFEAGDALTVNTAVTAGGDYTIRADDWFGAAVFNPSEGGDINIEDTAGGLTIGNVTATDELRITAENGNLTIAGGAITAANGIFLTTTGANAGAGFDISLQSGVTETGANGTVSLVGTGAINQTAGTITAGTLTGSAGTAANLASQNLIGTLAGFTTGGRFTLNDEDGLTISGAVTANGGPVTINTSDTGAGTAADLTVNAAVSSTTGAVTLVAERNLSVSDGLAINGKLGVTLTGASIALDDNTLTASDNNVTLSGATTLAGSNVVSTGAGSATFNGTVNGPGALTVNSSGVTTFNGAVGGTTALTSLTTDAGGSTVLTGGSVRTTGAHTYGDAVTVGAATTLTSTGSGAITFGGTVDGAQSLTVNTAGATTFNGAVGGTTALTSLTTDSAGTNAINANVTTSGNQSYGGNTSLDANLTALNGNTILGNLALVGTGTRKITANNASVLGSVWSSVSQQTGLSVDVSGNPSGSIAFNGSVGQIAPLAALALRGNSVTFGSTNNSFLTLAADVTTGLSYTGYGFTIGTVDGLSGIRSSGDVNLTSTLANFVLSQGINAGSADVNITVNGSLTGSGVITGNGVSINASNSIGASGSRVNTAATTLYASGGSGAVYISEADAVTLSGSAGTRFDVTAAGNLTTSGAVTATSGDVVLAATNGNISIGANVLAGGTGDIYLTANGTLSSVAGASLAGTDLFLTAQNFTGTILDAATLQETQDLSITDTAGGLTAVGLSAARDLSVTTTNGGNLTVQGASAGRNITLGSAGDLALTGAIDATGDTLTLNAAGNVTQTSAGVITAGTLTGSVGGSAALTLGANQITNLGAFTANRLQLADSGGLTVSGPVSGGTQEVSITTTGDLTVNAGVTSGTYVVLNASGAGSDILLNGAVSGGNEVGLTAGGTISQTAAGAINTNVFYASATGAVTLTAAANNVTSLLSSGGNGFALADAGGLTVTGTVDGGSGGVSLTTSGDLNVASNVTASGGTIALSATGAGSDIAVTNAGGIGSGSAHLSLTAGGDLAVSGAAKGIDVAMNAGGTLATGAITARDDIALRASGAIATGALTSGATVDAMGAVDVAGAADTLAGATLAGHDVNLSGNGLVVGQIRANGSGSDATLTGGASGIGNGSQDLDIRADGNVVLNSAARGRDIGLVASGSITTASLTTRDDVVVFADGAVSTGAVTSGATVDALGAADVAGVVDSFGGQNGGNDIWLRGSTVVAGPITATGAGSDVSLHGEVGNGSQDLQVAAGGNIYFSSSARGRDIALSAGGSITTGQLTARDDVVVRAAGLASLLGVTTGATVDALAAIDAIGAGDALAGAALGGHDISAIANAIYTLGMVANGSSSDVVLDGGASGIGHGDLDLQIAAGGNIALAGSSRGRDVALSAGGSVTTGSVTARDDIVVRGGAAVSTGALTSGTAVDALAAVDVAGAADTLAGATLAGNDVDLSGASVTFSGANSNGSGSDIAAQATSGTVSAGAATAGGNVRYQASGDLALTNTVTAAGTLTLLSGGAISQTAAINAQTLTGSSAGATNLNHSGNQIANLGAFSAGSLSLVDSGGLTITGSVNTGTGNATVRTSGGNMTIASTGGVTGGEVVLSTDQAFINNSGSDAITASNRWLVYSAAPDGNTYGGLDSGNTAIWNATYATLAPSGISGNRYVFAYQPTLTFTSLDDSKTYGTALTTSPYSVSGFHAGVAGAFLGDTAAIAFSGSPLLSSAGYAGNADVVGGPYAIGIGSGSLTSLSGYAFSFNGAGKLTITPKAINGSVVADDKTYDGTTNATGSVTLEGVLSGDDVTASAILAFIDANAGSNKTVTVSSGSLSGADAGNYTLSLPASALADIFKKAITGTVVADDKTYDSTTSATGTITLNGVIAGDQVTASAVLAFADANAGSGKLVAISGGTLSGADARNYTLILPASVVADIFRAALTVAADNLSKGQGAADPALTYSITAGQLFGGDQLTGSLARVSGELPGDYAILQGTLAASSNYELTFMPGVLTIEPRIVFTDDLGGLLSLHGGLGVGQNGELLILDERDCGDGNSEKRGPCNAGVQE
jgi:filamentous hemagglutinin family protein